MKKRYATRGYIVDAITKAIEENGPMTTMQLCIELDKTRYEVASVISRMRKDHPTMPQRLYIVRWTKYDDTGRDYPRAVYALGAKPDAKKPRKQPRKVIAKRWRDTRSKKVNSVFQLGIPLRERLQHERSIRSTSGGQPLQADENSTN